MMPTGCCIRSSDPSQFHFRGIPDRASLRRATAVLSGMTVLAEGAVALRYVLQVSGHPPALFLLTHHLPEGPVLVLSL